MKHVGIDATKCQIDADKCREKLRCGRGKIGDVTELSPIFLDSAHPLNPAAADRGGQRRLSTADSLLLRNLRGERTEERPVWFMRQAGRSLPEYRRVRQGTTMLEACLDPALVTEITLQPVRRHEVDAAIFFSDIVIPLLLAGMDVSIVAGRGPVFSEPARTPAQIERIVALPIPDFEPITAAVRLLVAELGTRPLIGFAGAPFTLASYVVEGGPSKDHQAARALMVSEPELWERLMGWLADVSGAFLAAQIQAGASVGQLFDSWAGVLSRSQYERSVQPYSRRALIPVRQLQDVNAHSVPLIHFGVGTAHLVESMADVGASAIGVDYRTDLAKVVAEFPDRAIQGNLDPAYLQAPADILRRQLDHVLAAGVSAAGHVFNLGHGVPPQTDADVLTRLVEWVHNR